MTIQRMCALALVLGALISLSEAVPQATNGRHRLPPPRDEGPLVTLLTPDEGRAINAPSLVVQALVAARQPDAWRRFGFGGFRVKGRHSGILERVTLALDGRIVRNVLVAPCRRQFVLDEVVSIATLADGPHTLEVTAIQGVGRGAQKESVTAVFSIDRTLPVAERNRIEEAATPSPFACFSARDDDDDEDHWGPRPRHPDVHGRFLVSGQGGGIDLAADRIVIAAGTGLRVLEPGSLRCDRFGRECRFEDRFHPFLRRLILERTGPRLWRFQIAGGPQWPRDAAVYLRIGDDWGGLDLSSGERIASLQLLTDEAHAATATVGPAGGLVQTTGSSGAILRLTIPAGALTAETEISVTPLAAPPLAGAVATDQPGVHLEPAGLVFATPATLTIDLTPTGTTFPAITDLFLFTSPLTMVPLPAALNSSGTVLTATLHHFTAVGPVPATTDFSDLAAWANAVLNTGETLTESDLESLAEIAEMQLQLGCGVGCVDVPQLILAAQSSLEAIAGSQCVNDILDPSDDTLNRWARLDAVSRQLHLVTPALTGCLDQVMGALIDRAAADALAHPAYDGAFARLLELADRARELGLTTQEHRALEALNQALRTTASHTLDTVQNARGTANETTVVHDSRDALQQELTWVTGPGAAVLTVAPTLDDYLQTSINGLTASGSFSIVSAGETVLGTAAQVFTCFPPPGSCDKTSVGIGSNDRTIAASRDGVTVSLGVRQSGNTLLVDVAATGRDLAPGQWEGSVLDAYFDVQFSNAGLATLMAEPQWPEPFPWGGAPGATDLIVYSLGLAYTTHGQNAGATVGLHTLEVRPCSDPGRQNVAVDGLPCEGTARVGANSVLRLRFIFYLLPIHNPASPGYHGQTFTFAATPLKMIYTPGNFGSPNVAPFAIAQQLQTAVNTSVPVTLTGDDLERDPITFAIATQPAHGRLQGLEPNIVYVPNQDFEGSDSFTFTVSDGTEDSGAATVFVQVGNPGGDGNSN